MKTVLAAVLAAILTANGLAMLLFGRWWYGAVPGVTSTGPFNPHFVKDIGAAYLTCGLALAWRAARATSPHAAGAVVAAAVFLGAHGAIHIDDEIVGPGGLADFVRDFPGVFLPALLTAWLAWTSRRADRGV